MPQAGMTLRLLALVTVSLVAPAPVPLRGEQTPSPQLSSAGNIQSPDAQNSASRNPDRLFPFCEGGKWGYIDSQGKVIVPPRLIKAGDFRDGLAWVQADEGLGCPGPARENGVHDSQLGYASVRRRPGADTPVMPGPDSKFGYFDRRGKVVIEPRYDDALDFSGGLAAVNIGAVSERFPRPFLKEGGKWGFIDKTGRVVIPIRFEWVDSKGFSEGLALVGVGQKRAFIDKTGRIVLTLEGHDAARERSIVAAYGFSEGRAVVSTSSGSGFIDKTGKWAIAPRFHSAHEFSEGLAAAGIGKKWGYVDHDGRITIPLQFDDGGDFSEGLAPILQGEHWSYIDGRGKLVITGPYNDQERFIGGLARVHVGGSFVMTRDGPVYWSKGAWFYINRKGDRIRQCCRDEGSPGYGKEFR